MIGRAMGHPVEHPGSHWVTHRLGLAAASALVSVAVWTGAPLFAVWVGSRAQSWLGGRSPGTGESMGAVVFVVVCLAAVELLLLVLLTRLSGAYDDLTGRPQEARRTSPWMRSMRGERVEFARQRHGISAIERIVVLSVVAAALSFELWFFFLAGSPLSNG
jgi:hypothetical protein